MTPRCKPAARNRPPDRARAIRFLWPLMLIVTLDLSRIKSNEARRMLEPGVLLLCASLRGRRGEFDADQGEGEHLPGRGAPRSTQAEPAASPRLPSDWCSR